MSRKPRARATVEVESPYLLEDQAAAYLRVAVQTIRNWRSNGLGTGPLFRKHGGVVVYDVQDLDRWSAARAATSTTQLEDTGSPPADPPTL